MKHLFSSKSDKRLVLDSFRTRLLKYWRRKTWSICGTYSKNIYLSLMMVQKESITTSSSSYPPCFLLNADNSSHQVLSSNLNGTSLAELKSCHSSTTSFEKSTYSRHAYKSPSTILQAMVISRRRTSKTTSLSLCQHSLNSNN